MSTKSSVFSPHNSQVSQGEEYDGDDHVDNVSETQDENLAAGHLGADGRGTEELGPPLRPRSRLFLFTRRTNTQLGSFYALDLLHSHYS